MTAAKEGRRLKVLHIDPERNWGGGEAQVLGLIAYLSKNGHANQVALDPAGRLSERCRELGIETVPIRVAHDLDLRTVPALRRRIERERYDIVHFHTKRAHALSLWLPKQPSRPPRYVVTRRMDYPEPNNWYTRLLYNRRVDGVVAISRRIGELLAQAGVEQGRIRVIHSGIELPKLQVDAGRATSWNGAVVGTAGVLEERKGHRYLLEAAAILKEQGVPVRYRIAGSGAMSARLREMVSRSGLQAEVELLGFVDDIWRFLESIDIFVLPSLHEGLGVAVLEAMAAGKPVVASRVGGLVDSVVDSVSGFLVEPRDPGALAGAIRRLVCEPELARAMGRRGRERVRENFTVERMAEANEAFYYALLERMPAE
ncbi:MAG TPA: glycosyltransferase family 4 protein, partial [Candidatus Eisenbacteria bacterium]|nr:glycosyltransferase family 4 protein [Candidatus Eisenbacteria bacterium]